MKHFFLSLSLLFLVQVSARSQTLPDSTQQQTVFRVFVDCRTRHCDLDYFRTEITVIDYVWDREDADVHILITTRTTGSGGTEFTLNFIGRNEFAGVEDIITTSSSQTDTDDDVRKRLVQVLKAGLVPYIHRTSLINRMAISFDFAQNEQVSTQPVDDIWNYWVFRSSLSGSGNGEDRFKYLLTSGNISASRITENWKVRLSLYGSRTQQTFTYTDETKEKDVQENYGLYSLIVKSLSDHWSVGTSTSGRRSTRSNYDLSVSFSPAIEYNFFPYSESTRRQLTVQYSVGVNYFNYTNSTIFDKMEETLLRQSLAVALQFKQPWGEMNTFVSGRNFLHDTAKLNLQTGGEVHLRVFRGLSLDFGGYITLVRDQLNLARGNASNEDVLLRRRELATDWRYIMGFGISYTFGSIFNNIVNPRFREYEE